jgi:hypothetical protein
VTASVEQRDGYLLVDVETHGAPDLAELQDRVGAIDGRLRVTPGRAGERLVRAELPCA